MYFTRTRFKIYVLLLETMYAYGDIHCGKPGTSIKPMDICSLHDRPFSNN